jgi:hypothetical protein
MVLAYAGTALGQPMAGDPVSLAPLRWGPLGLRPRIAVQNIGVDTNVYNEADNPTRDFTAGISPGADVYLRLGRLLLTSTSRLDWAYFVKNESQRSLNWGEDLKLELRLNRLVPYVQGARRRLRQRPNLDIDDRVETQEELAGAGLLVQPGARLSVSMDVRQVRREYGASLLGDDAIARALDGEQRGGDLSVRYALTPLTTLVARASSYADRYKHLSLRDADTQTIMTGFEFRPAALISGSVLVGYSRFRPLSSAVPPYTGPVAAVSAAYVMREMTRFGVTLNRNVAYSVEDLEPYAVTTDGQLTVTQVIGGDWYTTGRVGYTIMAFRRAIEGAPGATSDAGREDRVALVGVGIGRQLGDTVRVEFNADHFQRDSRRDDRQYSGLKFGGSVLYGF